MIDADRFHHSRYFLAEGEKTYGETIRYGTLKGGPSPDFERWLMAQRLLHSGKCRSGETIRASMKELTWNGCEKFHDHGRSIPPLQFETGCVPVPGQIIWEMTNGPLPTSSILV
ncbi:hypothetical protein M569_14876 [Genlisea aurea]|uniref:Uncharacterized protein n=1 Tax=Genlisea aurea TaxID=192259 RepID=S8BZW2_9LAMI|nr:hypothetical protein M569_14876 [Genlisea aurea]